MKAGDIVRRAVVIDAATEWVSYSIVTHPRPGRILPTGLRLMTLHDPSDSGWRHTIEPLHWTVVPDAEVPPEVFARLAKLGMEGKL